MATFDYRKFLKENKSTYHASLTEGQFSWMTQDTDQQIGSEKENTISVYMHDNKGNKWFEDKYDGYGEFGGKDYYELLDQMNGGTGDRSEGVRKAFDPTLKGKLLFPALTVSSTLSPSHDFTQEAEHDPNQSWYSPEYEDDEDDYDYGMGFGDMDTPENYDEDELDEGKAAYEYEKGKKAGEEIEKKKMKVSELKAKIKEMIVAEMDGPAEIVKEYDFLAELENMLNEAEGLTPLQDYVYQYEIEISGEDRAQNFLDDIKKLNTPQDVYDYYAYERDWSGSMDDDLENIFRQVSRKFKNLKEADEEVDAEAEATDDVTTDTGSEDIEVTDTETTAEVDPNVKAVQDALTQAQAAAQKLGDSKLTDQIGNTITFFTRAHVVDKPKGAVAEVEKMEEAMIPIEPGDSDYDIGYKTFFVYEDKIGGFDIENIKKAGMILANKIKNDNKIKNTNEFFRGFMDSWNESSDSTADKEDMYEAKKPVNEVMFPMLKKILK